MCKVSVPLPPSPRLWCHDTTFLRTLAAQAGGTISRLQGSPLKLRQAMEHASELNKPGAHSLGNMNAFPVYKLKETVFFSKHLLMIPCWCWWAKARTVSYGLGVTCPVGFFFAKDRCHDSASSLYVTPCPRFATLNFRHTPLLGDDLRLSKTLLL